MPQKTKAALELAALAARAAFISESGELDVSTIASLLLTGMAVAGDGDEDSDYGALVRSHRRAIVRSRYLVFKAVAADGVVHDWGGLANRTMDMITGQVAFTSADYRDLAGVIFEFERLQSARELAVKAVLGNTDPTSRPQGVLAFSARPAGTRCVNSACGRPMRGFAICSDFFAPKSRLWQCAACNSCSLRDSVECSAHRSTGCCGTRDSSRVPTPEEAKGRSQAMATASRPSGGGGAGRGGGVAERACAWSERSDAATTTHRLRRRPTR